MQLHIGGHAGEIFGQADDWHRQLAFVAFEHFRDHFVTRTHL